MAIGKSTSYQCLVINQRHQTPGKGIGWFLLSTTDFKKLSPQARKRIVDSMLHEVYAYSHWDDVLRRYDLQPIEMTTESILREEGRTALQRINRGEGAAHRRLKEYIAANPVEVGLSNAYRGETEYTFPSADCLDILFKKGSSWVGVEVKEPVSDDLDLNRGPFQCVKYHALLQAEQSLLQRGIDCRILLAHTRELPTHLEDRRIALGIDTCKVTMPA